MKLDHRTAHAKVDVAPIIKLLDNLREASVRMGPGLTFGHELMRGMRAGSGTCGVRHGHLDTGSRVHHLAGIDAGRRAVSVAFEICNHLWRQRGVEIIGNLDLFLE